MQIITRYFQRADARSAWSTPAENVGTAPRPGRPAAGAKLRAEPIRTPGVGVRSAEPGGSDRARVPAALGPVAKITSVYRYYSPYRLNFSRLNISTVDLRVDISMALLFHVIPPFLIHPVFQDRLYHNANFSSLKYRVLKMFVSSLITFRFSRDKIFIR